LQRTKFTVQGLPRADYGLQLSNQGVYASGFRVYLVPLLVLGMRVVEEIRSKKARY